MKALMNSWWKRAEAYTFWRDKNDEDCPPLISFAVDAFSYDLRPASYYDYNDTDRWRIWQFRLDISRRTWVVHIPYKKLPDYVPTGKAMLRTRRVQKEHEEKRNAATKV